MNDKKGKGIAIPILEQKYVHIMKKKKKEKKIPNVQLQIGPKMTKIILKLCKKKRKD
jgi:hypothetical protein